ncbi:MAG TPA: hypothetical protein VNE00_26235 [Paraburkholderia sp.]|jgi:hypothetical protein|nr:hypothetical protein [Paraburkholderia sp.]
MFNIHIGEAFHLPTHNVPTTLKSGAAHTEPCGRQPASFAADPQPDTGSGHSVLRLRGGGGAHGKGGIDGDREHLTPFGGSSKSYDGVSRAQARFDYEMQTKKDELRRLVDEKNRLKSKVWDLEARKSQASPGSSDRDEFEYQLTDARREYDAKAREVEKKEIDIVRHQNMRDVGLL